MRTARILPALLCIAALCAPSAAVAKNKTHAPPGNSGVDEYLEVVPGGGGNRPVRPPTGGSGHALSGKARGALRSYGRDGQSVSRLADSTSDATPSPRKRKSDVSRTLGTEASKPTDRGTFAALKGAFTAL